MSTQFIFSNAKYPRRTGVVFGDVKEVDVSSVVTVVAGVVVEIVVVLIVVVDTVGLGVSSSMAFSEDEPVLFTASCRQHCILSVGHVTSSRTSLHIHVVSVCTHTPGHSSTFAVFVKVCKKPVQCTIQMRES